MMRFQISRHRDPSDKEGELLAEFESNELAYNLFEPLQRAYPTVMFSLHPLKHRSNPRWLIINASNGIPTTIAQFAPEFGFIAKSYVLVLCEQYGPHFAVKEMVPGTNVRMMGPDKSGQMVPLSEGPMQVGESGIMVPFNPKDTQ